MIAAETETPPAAPADGPGGSGYDPAAPYGRFRNGKARKTPQAPRKRGSGGGGRRSAPRVPDYRPGILGVAQAITLPLAFTSPIDAATVQTYAPGIAEALNELAKIRPEVAAALDHVLQAGPYGALVGAVVPLVVQLLHNHAVIPDRVALAMGATPREVIAQQLRERADAMAEEERRRAAADADIEAQARAAEREWAEQEAGWSRTRLDPI